MILLYRTTTQTLLAGPILNSWSHVVVAVAAVSCPREAVVVPCWYGTFVVVVEHLVHY